MSRRRSFKAMAVRFASLVALVFFFTTVSFLLFTSSVENLSEVLNDKELIHDAAVFTFLNMVFLIIITLCIAMLMRERYVEKPLEEILRVTEKVKRGDFSARIGQFGGDELSVVAENLNLMIAELGSIETLRSDFIANVSHELKTPVAVIRNYAQLLSLGTLSEGEKAEAVEAIDRASGKLSKLISDILRLNKLENQQIFPRKERFELNENVSEALIGYEEAWERKKLRINVEMDTVTVLSDSSLLTIVWDNLISNAVKFTPEGGSVSVSVKASGGYAAVTVSDTGPGFDEAAGKHIFDKFYQVRTKEKPEGNGLGLATVKRILTILGLEIQVESVPGEGSSFRILVPANP